MQNLTAKYNILYNAKLLVEESDRNLTTTYQDDYDKLLPVFREPDEIFGKSESKNLDDAISRATKIVNEKAQSNYIDDAYLIIGKANHLKANFYNATEFFSYILKNYPKEKELKQAALVWQARSFMASERFEEAEAAIDTALKYINTEKKSRAEIYAAAAQLDLYAQKDTAAISLLKKAVSLTKQKQQKIRWIYILGQLEELTGNNEAADDYFYRVTKSNASFELALNAMLNLIRTSENPNGKPINRLEKLKALLKDDKNTDFTDQVYYQIAEEYLNENNISAALENYKISVAKSTNNKNQKGLSYLKIADINFEIGNYADAKKYYDSTLTALNPSNPGFDQIRKKADNLELLANRLNIIARQDTLQMLAALPEKERDLRISHLIREQTQKAMPVVRSGLQNSPFYNPATSNRSATASKFYFYNTMALSQGFSNFKNKWGDRKLEDNWRRSDKVATDIVNNSIISPDAVVTGIPNTANSPSLAAKDLQTGFLNEIPLTAQQKAASDNKIITAYYDIGNFYRDVLDDNAKAISTYLELMVRYPENPNKPAIYYNLYRLYNLTDKEKSDFYKNNILKDYAETPYAKIILNPNYSNQTDKEEVALNNFYTQAYSSYVSKDYHTVISETLSSQQHYKNSNLSPQIAYLNALAIGHTQKLNAFEKALKDIITSHPGDKLITPVVKQNLAYIDSTRLQMSKRVTALVEYDANEPAFIEEPKNMIAEYNVVSTVQKQPEAPIKEPASKTIAKPDQSPTVIIERKAETPLPLKEAELFNEDDALNYYFVINVDNPEINLSPSRFGIGQFNRANLPASGIKHQLKKVNNENQLIFVGAFNNRNDAKDYYNNVIPLLKDIMKISAGTYDTFIITKQNLDKLNDRKMIEKYVEYFKRSY